MFLATALPVAAQQINISLHPTAVPDSFEVRLTSSGSYDGLINGTFTIRWESAAGGVLNNGDIRAACDGYSFGNIGGTQDVLGHRYFTINFFGIRPLWPSCSITSIGMSLGGVRIRELSGCRNVAIANNAFIDLNNFAYYISIGGYDFTGDVTSGVLSSGVCPPCVPPMITSASASPIPYCGVGGDLLAQATGTTPDYAWYGTDGALLSWLLDAPGVADGAGTYTVVVSNACGADTLEVEAVVDPNLCEPPVIDSVWFEPLGVTGIYLHAMFTSSCAELTWIMPWGVVGSFLVANPSDGGYTAVVNNACGTDTLILYLVAPEPCIGPVLSNVDIISQDSCSTGHVQFTATVSGPGPETTAWYAPTGVQLTGAPQFTLPYAPWGTYTFVASNFCTSDTVAIFHGPADTTGLAACQPPQILSVSAPPLSCILDTVQLIASTVLTGPCASLVWSNVDNLSISGDTTTAVVTYGPVVLTATNGCGQASTVVPLVVEYPQQMVRRFCGNPGVVSLDSIMHVELPYEGGEWSYEGLPHPAFYDPAVDTTGLYVYISVSSCPVVHFYLTEYQAAYAGEDSAIVVCAADPSFPMFDLIGGAPASDGYWQFSGTATDNVFDPAEDIAGVYAYRVQDWHFLGFYCLDEALLTVEVTPAVTWYTDLDNDGLGDPHNSIQACEQPVGFVANADDACPELFGTVGDACDDGDPTTVNDMIDPQCECAGDPDNGITDQATDNVALWPNPNRGDAFFLQLQAASGKTILMITDPTGRIVFSVRVLAAKAPCEVVISGGLADGTYFVSIVGERSTETLRLVVER